VYLKTNTKQTYAYTGAREHRKGLESVVFVHGTGMDHTVWVLPARYFARHGFNVLATDLPGHGRSEGPPPETIEAMSDAVLAAMDSAKIRTAALVGHSMGSLVALALAARYPERTRSLALIGTAVPMAVHKALLSNAARDDHGAIDMLTYWGYSKAAQLGGNENPGMWMVGGTLRLLEQSKDQVIHMGLDACSRYNAGIDHASAVRCPTLFILGRRDIMTPARTGEELAKTVTGSKVTILEGTGHSLMMERPNDVLDALIDIV
jgi:pimeloyl-ACP methyl ester carboxylesterase